MKDHTLLNTQKNRVFDAVVQFGLRPQEFREVVVDSTRTNAAQITRFEHIPSGFFIEIDWYEGYIFLTLSPGDGRRTSVIGRLQWNEAEQYLFHWLDALRKEVSVPDKWAAIASEPDILTFVERDSDNSKYNAEELKQIKDGLNEIGEYLRNVIKIDLESVNSRLNYLEEAATRLGKKDWKVLLIGILTTIVVSAYATPEATREIFTFAGAALNTILVKPHLIL